MTDNTNVVVSGSLQADLEKKLIAERLAMLGLSPEEINTRLAKLSNQDIHKLATELVEIQVGGDDWLFGERGFNPLLFLLGVLLFVLCVKHGIMPLQYS